MTSNGTLLLTELLDATLVQRPLDESLFAETSEVEWQQCFDLALGQQVLAMTFPVMTALPKEQRTDFVLWSKWMAYAQSIAEQSAHKRQVVEKIGGWLSEEGLTTTIVKGFSLAALYPNPNLREFGDIDIFSGADYEAVNACFRKHGIEVGKPDGHHAHIKVDGVSVEHHFAFSNSRVRNGLQGPEAELQRLAAIGQRSTSIAGICFPCPAFTFLHTGWHAYQHFLQEKIQLRHVIDCAVTLWQLPEEDAEAVNAVKGNTPWGRLLDTLTAIALHRFGLPQEWFPEKELAAAEAITSEKEQRVWNDIMAAPRTAKGITSTHRRLQIAKRMLRNRWKFNAYASISAERFVWEEFVGHVRS
jgi:hypothetical protein